MAVANCCTFGPTIPVEFNPDKNADVLKPGLGTAVAIPASTPTPDVAWLKAGDPKAGQLLHQMKVTQIVDWSTQDY